MSRFAPKTLRKMPPAAREIARLANERNELASVQTRLANRIGGLVSTEMMARASERVFCSNAAHAGLVDAALRYLKAIDDPALGPGARTDALMALQAAAAHFDPDKLFEGDGGPKPPVFEFSGSAGRGRFPLQGFAAPLSDRARQARNVENHQQGRAFGTGDGSAGRGRFPLQGFAAPLSFNRARQDPCHITHKGESKCREPSTR